MEKTNVMRILDAKKIEYKTYTYPHKDGEFVDGASVAALLNQNPQMVFKTLVCVSNTKRYYVCVIPVEEEIDLKKAANAFGVKALELISMKDLFGLTGYIRGGCSPIGMKKVFPTLVDESALLWDTMIFSAGRIGMQVEMNPLDLKKIIPVEFKEIRRIQEC